MLTEIQEPLDRLDLAWSELEASVRSLSHDQVGFQPGEGWSIHEVVDHMQRVEEAFLGMMSRSEGRGRRRRSPIRSLGFAAVHFVMKRGLRVRIPRGAAPMRPSRERTLDELFKGALAYRTAAREAFDTLAPEDLSRSAAKHPVGGALDFREAFWFVEAHFRHHLRQIDRLRRHPGFPA